MNSETNLKPTAVDKISISLTTVMEQMQEMGLSERDLIMLLQDRAKGNIN
ncbi:MAG: hypothetical protein GPJ51_11100, partial [Candidatus Heimdallarchaeota archaeon]|nr:hypothetical protein [Candidatus Heimdallarchaeota archaeon]